ncbi:hypothetical protein HK105_203587 [Polyrhizophydium stewartii]|uniref:ubiquitinyl hydrolase 1 n=1 Tax=Polyrhizophydium stewartii TaxID=2732419 RepID=A0ABR4NB91_9FUNG
MKSPKRGNAPGSSRRNNLPAALRPETLFKSASSLLVVHKEEASQLLSKAVWDTFTPDEQRELLALLPSVDTVSQANPDAPRAIRDGLLRKDYHLCDSFNRMIEDLAEGLYTDREQRLMLQNFEKTVHKFDEWKARNYEAVWGDQLDISRWRRLAGAASEISFAELCLNARVFVGDTLHIKKTFKKLGMSLDLFAEITHISKQGVATLRCGQTTWTSDTLTQIENKFIDIGIPNLPKSERPNGNAWKVHGKKVGSMFDVRADYSSGTRQGELAGGAHGQSTDTPDTAVASTPQHADSGAATEALVPSFVPHNCRDVEVGDPLEGSPWVAIEANPGVFTELAQRIGIRGVEVQEVFTLDPDELKAMQPIHGLIFLFQWGDTDSKQSEIAAQDGQIPENVFFINQARRASAVVQNACATQALISIALNCHSLDLDDSLKAFKEFSAEMTPAVGLYARPGFEQLPVAENGAQQLCQTDMPVLHYPMPTKKVEEPRRKKSKPSESDDSDESSDDDAGNASDFEKSTKSSRKRRPKNASKARKGKRAKEENDEAEDEGHDGFGFHFIGYLPIDGVVWELDGLKRAPRDLGPVPANGDWVRVVVKTLEEKMASDSLEFNLLALVTDRRQLIAQQLKQLQGSIAYLDGLADPENYKYSMLLETLGDHANLLEGLEHNATLSAAREALEAHIKTLGQRLREEDEKRDEYAAENVRRRFNYAPFLRKWFETMASKHQLDRLLD